MIKKLSINSGYTRDAVLGDIVELTNHDVDVVECEESGRLMVHIAPAFVVSDDFEYIKDLGLTIGVPSSKEDVCIQEAVDGNIDTITKLYLYFTQDEEMFSIDGCFTTPKLKS